MLFCVSYLSTILSYEKLHITLTSTESVVGLVTHECLGLDLDMQAEVGDDEDAEDVRHGEQVEE